MDKVKRFFFILDDDFDKDFGKIVQSFFAFGFYQPKPSKSRAALGILTFITIIFSNVLAHIREAILSINEKNLSKTLFCAMLFVFNLPLLVQTVCFSLNQEIHQNGQEFAIVA